MCWNFLSFFVSQLNTCLIVVDNGAKSLCTQACDSIAYCMTLNLFSDETISEDSLPGKTAAKRQQNTLPFNFRFVFSFPLMLQARKQEMKRSGGRMMTGTCIFNTEFCFLDLFNLPYLLTGLNLSLNLSIYFCDTGRHEQISGCLWSVKYSNCFISFWWPISDLYELMPFPSY